MNAYGMKYTVYTVLTTLLCIAAIAGTCRGNTAALHQSEETLSEESAQAVKGSLHRTRTLEMEELETLEGPPMSYWGQDGREYELSHWKIKNIPGCRLNRKMEKRVIYAGVEGAEGLPESITITEEETGVPAKGELSVRDTRVLREQWQEGFSVPVTFHSYGADEYEAGSLTISGENVLTNTDELAGELLSMMSLSPRDYRIHSIEWSGEPYMDASGQVCRQAMAKGDKLLRDYEITYEGEISWMKPVSYEMEMVYRPVVQHKGMVESEEALPVSKPAPTPVGETEKGLLWIRSGFIITVAASLMGILVGIVLLLILCERQRRERKRGRYLPRIKG